MPFLIVLSFYFVLDRSIARYRLIVDKHHKRSTWKMARVVEVDNEDGHARKIFVRPADGKIQVLDRTKLVLLELDGGD